MKGQLTIEYMFSFVGFVILMLFIYSNFSLNIPNFFADVKKEKGRLDAYQLSELLINDDGEPEDWNEVTVLRPGLSLEENANKNFESLEKIINLNDICSNYLIFQQKFSTSIPYKVSFYEIGLVGQRDRIMECNPPSSLVQKTQLNTTVRRIVTFYDQGTESIKLGELVVEV